jgi:hypothetical protein
MFVEIFLGYLIKSDYSIFRTGLDGHICHCHTRFHRHFRKSRPDKLHRTIKRTIDADSADNREDYVFAIDTWAELALQYKLH